MFANRFVAVASRYANRSNPSPGSMVGEVLIAATLESISLAGLLTEFVRCLQQSSCYYPLSQRHVTSNELDNGRACVTSLIEYHARD
jgi:hypothetical protein